MVRRIPAWPGRPHSRLARLVLVARLTSCLADLPLAAELVRGRLISCQLADLLLAGRTGARGPADLLPDWPTSIRPPASLCTWSG
jgi:hypothetical protein